MIWNWLSKFMGKKQSLQRKRVVIDIPFEQHRYRKESFDSKSTADTKANNTTDC